jgi:hypothetical protein
MKQPQIVGVVMVFHRVIQKHWPYTIWSALFLEQSNQQSHHGFHNSPDVIAELTVVELQWTDPGRKFSQAPNFEYNSCRPYRNERMPSIVDQEYLPLSMKTT